MHTANTDPREDKPEVPKILLPCPTLGFMIVPVDVHRVLTVVQTAKLGRDLTIDLEQCWSFSCGHMFFDVIWSDREAIDAIAEFRWQIQKTADSAREQHHRLVHNFFQLRCCQRLEALVHYLCVRWQSHDCVLSAAVLRLAKVSDISSNERTRCLPNLKLDYSMF